MGAIFDHVDELDPTKAIHNRADGRKARDADETHDLLRRLGDLTGQELDERACCDRPEAMKRPHWSTPCCRPVSMDFIRTPWVCSPRPDKSSGSAGPR